MLAVDDRGRADVALQVGETATVLTVLPSANNRTFLAAPSGIGSSGINASGTREDSTNYLFDGVNLSDMVQNQITFQPNIDSIQEFKVQTNAFSAECPQVPPSFLKSLCRA